MKHPTVKKEISVFYFFLPFLVTALVLLILGVIRPSIVNQLLSVKLTRLKIILIFGVMTAIFACLIVVTAPQAKKTGIEGASTSQPAETTTQIENPTTDQKTEPAVKKSSTGICHAQGTTYFNKTTNYKSFDSIETCLKSGGRLPKK